MSHDTPRPRTVPVPEAIRVYVAELVCQLGPTRAAAHVGVSRPATLAVALGSPVMPGTLALVRESMRRAAA